MTAQELADVRHRFALIRREHGAGVPHCGQAFQHLPGHLLGGRGGQDNPRFLLQPDQFFIQLVIGQIRHNRGVMLVIGLVRLSNGLDEFPHSVDVLHQASSIQ